MEFYQYREVVKRDVKGDPIVKISQVIISNMFQFGLALRTSGKVDFYWNYTYTSTPDEYFSDISSNYLSLFMRQD